MYYEIYKLKFPNGVHFGNGMLNDSDLTLKSDTLFSALCVEAAKYNKIDELISLVENDALFISDLFPYYNNKYMIPKPMIYIESKNKGNSIEKKKVKKLNYIAIDELKSYLKAHIEHVENYSEKIGKFNMITKAAVENREETLPYHVGTYLFEKESGLYFIAATNEKTELIFELLNSLSYSGIGGKRSSGLGRFTIERKNNVNSITDRICFNRDKNNIDFSKKNKYMLLSTSMTFDRETLDRIIDGASYSLIKRSGFIDTGISGVNNLKKKTVYLFKSGSCFNEMFSGDLINVSPKGYSHMVYRYAKAIFMEVF